MENLRDLIKSGEKYYHCFEFILRNGAVLFLTSASNGILCRGKKYLPFSGVSLNTFEFNDSAFNYLTIRGIFEEGGIQEATDLTSSNVRILFYFENKNIILEWLYYNFSEISHDSMSFSITLTSEAFKLNTTLLKNYSSTCRASFGDSRCGINLGSLSKSYKIANITNAKIFVIDLSKPDGFYLNGVALLCDIQYDVVSHEGSLITLRKAPSCDIKDDIYLGISLILIPCCDKSFKTCRDKYHNAINFRGEPFIP